MTCLKVPAVEKGRKRQDNRYGKQHLLRTLILSAQQVLKRQDNIAEKRVLVIFGSIGSFRGGIFGWDLEDSNGVVNAQALEAADAGNAQ